MAEAQTSGIAAGGDLEKSTAVTGDSNRVNRQRTEGNQSVYVGLDRHGRASEDSDGRMIVSAISDIRDALERLTELLAAVNTEVKLIQQGFRMDLKMTEAEIGNLRKELTHLNTELIHARQEVTLMSKRIDDLDRHRMLWIRIVSASLIFLFCAVAVGLFLYSKGLV